MQWQAQRVLAMMFGYREITSRKAELAIIRLQVHWRIVQRGLYTAAA